MNLSLSPVGYYCTDVFSKRNPLAWSYQVLGLNILYFLARDVGGFQYLIQVCFAFSASPLRNHAASWGCFFALLGSRAVRCLMNKTGPSVCHDDLGFDGLHRAKKTPQRGKASEQAPDSRGEADGAPRADGTHLSNST